MDRGDCDVYSPGMISHVAWDWNGTLLDDVLACVKALNGILDSRGLGTVSHDEYLERFRFPVFDYYVELGFDFTDDDRSALSAEYHRHYVKYSAACPLREGTLAVLKGLRERGVRMSVLSACESGMLAEMVHAREIGEYFDGLYGLDNYFADSKVAIGREFMQKLDVGPREVLLVGDTCHDHEVAAELGVRCVLMSGGHQSDARLRGCGCDLVPDIGSVIAYVEGII